MGGVCGEGCCDIGDGSRGVCRAEGSTCSSGKLCSQGQCPPPEAISCVNGTFPSFTRACANNDSCSFGMHQINCCGSQQAIGFNHSQKDAFEAAEITWSASCPQCGCATQLPVDDDGNTCNADPFVSCDSGMCRTHCITR
jgi:hypothetical protein